MKYIKPIRYIKFGLAILLFELVLGRICYEYGYARGSDVIGVGSMFAVAAYALAYVVICLCQGKGETSRGTNIFSTLVVGVPFIAILIVAIMFSEKDSLLYTIIALVVLASVFVLETVILVLHIRQEKSFNKQLQSELAK
ncbi:MAG: hypothetical protein K2N74_05180 [Clostridiales bacterium]|nr:hypothetical protein [Clostridiales bacterium]